MQKLNIKYSTFYSENLMENAASDDISNIFSQESDLSEPAVVEVPGEQETIELKEIGLTLSCRIVGKANMLWNMMPISRSIMFTTLPFVKQWGETAKPFQVVVCCFT